MDSPKVRYLCACRQVDEETVKKVIEAGARYLEQIAAECGAGAECGSCHLDIEDLITQEEMKETK
jgi:bacterioferritin-associated ferredoxin